MSDTNEMTPEEQELAQALANELGYRIIRVCGNFATEEGLDMSARSTQLFIEAVLKMLIEGMPNNNQDAGPEAKA